MAGRDWNQDYAQGDLPWDTGEPDPHLVELVSSGVIGVGRALEVGCGTGTNAVWLATQGFDVVGIDLSSLAVERARKRAAASSSAERCRFEVQDFLADSEQVGGPFTLVFDRGCFHVFDDAATQARFAARVCAQLAVGGLWLSLIGSTEGPAREMGPPRRSARDIMNAIEPALEVRLLRAIEFDTQLPGAAPAAWLSLARRREIPAQPSSDWSQHA